MTRADIYLRREGQTLVPDSAADAMLLEADYPAGKVLRAKLSYPRSLTQNNLYWAGLHVAVDNMPEAQARKYPVPVKLHKALLEVCGFVTVQYPLGGSPRLEADSTAFDKMTGKEFNVYFEEAQTKFVETFGFDPWAEVLARKRSRKGGFRETEAAA